MFVPMNKQLGILFYEDGSPMDCRCVERFIKAFSKGYQEVVERIIIRSEKLDTMKEFGYNLADLMPSFKMTRAGAFHGLKITNESEFDDPNGVAKLCWNHIEKGLQELKLYIKRNATCERVRVMADLPPEAIDYVIESTAGLFEKLKRLRVGKSLIGPVGASKVLFAALPEVALPVDTLEWDDLFNIDRYDVILSTMVREITAWEKAVYPNRLNALSPSKATTLPAIYNILAMAARNLSKAKW